MTKLLTIGLLLLTYGVVEAVTEGRAIDGKTGQDCLYRYSKAGLEISDCKPYSKGPALVTAEEIWADQKNKHKPGDAWPKGDGCNTCEMDQYGTSYCTTLYCRGKNLEFENEPLPRELATCDPDMTKCETPCEKEMKEVMREVDGILKLNHESLGSRKPGEARISLNLSPVLYRWWANVMQECVK